MFCFFYQLQPVGGSCKVRRVMQVSALEQYVGLQLHLEILLLLSRRRTSRFADNIWTVAGATCEVIGQVIFYRVDSETENVSGLFPHLFLDCSACILSDIVCCGFSLLLRADLLVHTFLILMCLIYTLNKVNQFLCFAFLYATLTVRFLTLMLFILCIVATFPDFMFHCFALYYLENKSPI